MPATLQAEIERTREFLEKQHVPATQRAYANDFKIFSQWCLEHQELYPDMRFSPLPATPERVAMFLADQAEKIKPATLNRRLAAIRYYHRRHQLPVPTQAEIVRAVHMGIKRSRGVAPLQKEPITREILFRMLAEVPNTIMGLRDYALMILMFGGGFRRSEIANLKVGDLRFVDEGLRVRLRFSKTDQEGQGASVAIVTGAYHCPVKAVQNWLRAAGIDGGYVFRRVLKNGRVPDNIFTCST